MHSVAARTLALGALCTAALALAASVVAAVGPAEGESAEYTWPPVMLPAASPEEGWYAPLPLLNRVPASMEINVPCELAPPLSGGEDTTVLATARRTEETRALLLALRAGALELSVGQREIAILPWPDSCPLHVEIRDGEVRLPTDVVRLETETPDQMPLITGLFSGLDLQHGAGPRVFVRTRTYATSASTRQTVAAILAVALAWGAFLALANPLPGDASRRLRGRVASVWNARAWTDVVVFGALLVWWILSPAFFDDSWLWVVSRVYDDVGTIGSYFDNWGVNSPLGQWLDLFRHDVVGSTHLVVARIPTLIVLAGGWVICRSCLHLAAGSPSTRSVRWALAGVFLVGAMAWGMTLRFEPLVSVVALAGLAAMTSFAKAPRLAPLTIALTAAVVGVTVHPAGLIAVSPILAAGPEVLRWLVSQWRKALVPLTAIVCAGVALTIVAFTFGGDLDTRLMDARLLAQGQFHDEPAWREYVRYRDFGRNGADTALRRLSLALLALPVLAWVTLPSSSRAGISTLPARSVAAGLVLLAFVPSKWPWHFGALAGMGAVAVAAEVARFARVAHGSPPRWTLRASIAVGLVLGAGVWSWRAKGQLAWADLQSSQWDEVFGLGRPHLGATVAVAVAVGIAAWRIRRFRPVLRPHTVIAATTSAVSFAVVAVTAWVLVQDAATSPWSPARQNLGAVVGRDRCGIAHHLSGDSALLHRIENPRTVTLLVPPVSVYFPCATIPTIDGGLVEVPNLIAYDTAQGLWPLAERDGPFAAIRDLYDAEDVGEGLHGLKVMEVARSVPRFARVDAMRRG